MCCRARASRSEEIENVQPIRADKGPRFKVGSPTNLIMLNVEAIQIKEN